MSLTNTKIEFMGKEKYDWNRMWSFTTYGLVIHGPLLHYTYQYIMPWIAPGKASTTTVAKKLLFSQTIFTRVSIGTFYLTLPLLQSKTFNEGYEEFCHKMKPTLVTNYKVWPFL